MSQFYVNNSSSSPLPPTVATSYLLDDGNSAVPSANILQVLGGSGTFTSLGVSNQIKVSVINDGFIWTEQSGPTFNIPIQNGVFCNAPMTVNLPATAGLTIGNTVIIFVDNIGQVVVQANTGQKIQIGQNISGLAGTATSPANFQGGTLELVFKPSDATWHTVDSMGSWSVI